MLKILPRLLKFLLTLLWAFAIVKLAVFVFVSSVLTWQVVAELAPTLKPEVYRALKLNMVWLVISIAGATVFLVARMLNRKKRPLRGLDFKYIPTTRKPVKLELTTKKGKKVSFPATEITRRRRE